MKNHKAEIDGEAASHITVAALSQGLKSKNEDKPSHITNCKFCSSTHVRGRCPAYRKHCNNFGQFNHFAKACRKEAKSDKKTVQKLDVRSSDPSDDDFEVHGVQFKVFGLDSKKGWFIDTIVNDHKVICQVDTGAQVSVMDVSTLKSIGITNIKTTRARLTAYGGSELNVVGKVILDVVQEAKKPEPVLFYIIQGKEKSVTLLSMSAIQSKADQHGKCSSE